MRVLFFVLAVSLLSVGSFTAHARKGGIAADPILVKLLQGVKQRYPGINCPKSFSTTLNPDKTFSASASCSAGEGQRINVNVTGVMEGNDSEVKDIKISFHE